MKERRTPAYEWKGAPSGARVCARHRSGQPRPSPIDAAARASAATLVRRRGDAVLRLVDDPHDSGNVDESTWAALSSKFDANALLEMLGVVGFHHLISFVLHPGFARTGL
jgi:hypothetical protein